jgi:ribosomal-protein-alanine N-acetyltransferase
MDRPMPPVTLPALHGPHILLRAMDDADAPALFAIYGDPEVMRYTDEPPFPDQATVGPMLRSVRDLLAQGSSVEWAIVPKAGGPVIGTCGLHGFDDAAGMAEVGCLLRRADWGRGIMREAVDLLAAYARDTLRLRRLAADVAPDNVQAQRLFAKLGYRQERADWWTLDLDGAISSS